MEIYVRTCAECVRKIVTVRGEHVKMLEFIKK
jgi:hypothetical protein